MQQPRSLQHERQPDLGEAAVSRRRLLQAGAVGVAASLAPWGSTAQAHGSRLFSLGVASGDPSAHSVVLWTRLAPAPLEGGGMAPRPVAVRWEVATDPGMQAGGPAGRGDGAPALGPRGPRDRGRPGSRPLVLLPLSCAWARTAPPAVPGPSRAETTCPGSCASAWSPARTIRTASTPRTRTWPSRTSTSSSTSATTSTRTATGPLAPRQVQGGEIITLDDYRNRYALYRLDPALQAAHAAFPFITTFDDHEVDNNYAGDTPEDDQDPAAFLARKAIAYQAYYEHLPLRPASPADQGASSTSYRRLQFGRPGRSARARHPPVPQRSALRRRPEARLSGDRSIRPPP